MTKPKLILFDIGNVLIDYSNVFKTAAGEQNIPLMAINDTFDKYNLEITTGIMTPQELYHACLDEHELEADREYDFLTSWLNDYASIKPTFDFVTELSKNYSIGLLSNIYKGMVPQMIKKHQIPDIPYSHFFLSCDLRMQKPDLEIYKYVQMKSGQKGDEIFFIDDKAENTQAADSFGWSTHIFQWTDPIAEVATISTNIRNS